jgi:hypothetical protein
MTNTFDTFNSESSVAEAMDWIYANTNFPRFEEFQKNPDKWRVNEEDIFISLAQMEVFFRSRVKSVNYYWRGKYRCKTLEELQRVTRNEGYKGSDLDYQPVVLPTDGTSNHHKSKLDITVNIYSKIEMRLMGGVVVND